MKKIFLTLLVLVITFLSACSSNTWVLEKDRLNEVGDVASYVGELQTNQTDFRGYRIFTISEGKKMVVVSSGTSNKTIEFTGADVTKNNTSISVVEVNKESDEENSYILIGLDKIEGELTVVTENGEEFMAFE
ncbi:MAG: hypothetical protein ACK4M9_21145 [Anaerobacillus sp.]|uniref:hypothetical protein n=1 Tax=Anaerobacillus sp. TaxID=1872506 RepID=UPI003919065C